MTSFAETAGNYASVNINSTVRDAREIERIEHRVREHIAQVQNAIDHVAQVLETLRGPRGEVAQLNKANHPQNPGLIGEIGWMQSDLDERLTILSTYIAELRQFA